MGRQKWLVVVAGLLLLLCCNFSQRAQATEGEPALAAKPSFRSIAVTVTGLQEGDSVKLFYKKASDGTYIQGREAQTAWREGTASGGFELLKEGTVYSVKAEVWRDGSLLKNLEQSRVTTLKSGNYDSMDQILPPLTEMKLTPLYQTAGVYVPYSESGAVCRVKYREKADVTALCNIYFYTGTLEWKPAYPPVYQPEAGQFAGSIVDLKEGTEYEVSAEVIVNQVVIASYRQTMKTRTSEVSVAKEYDLSELYSGSGELALTGLKGSPEGWIKITDRGGNGVRADHETQNQAVLLLDCAYVWLDGIQISGGKYHGVHLTGDSDNIKLSACDISGWGRDGTFAENAGGYKVGYIDKDGNRINNDAGIMISDVTNIVIERSYIHDANVRTSAWAGSTEIDGKTVEWSSVHPGGASGIYVRSRGGLVIRYNDIVGSEEHRFNDAIEGYANSGLFGGLAKDAEVYGNVLAYCQDDGIEMDGGAVNVRVFENRIEETFSGISTAPNLTGPSFVYRNVIHNLRDEFDKNSSAVKAGGGSGALGTTHYFFNTFVSNSAFAPPAFGIHAVGYGNDADREAYRAVTRNNLFYNSWSGRTAIDEKYGVGGNSFDYDLAGNTGTDDKAGVFYLVSPTISGVNANEANALLGLPEFSSLQGSDYRLAENSLGWGGAVRLDGFDGRSVGALDQGSGGLIPARPILAAADRYTVTLRENGEAQLTVTAKGETGKAYRVQKSADFMALHVEQPVGIVPDDGTLSLTIRGTEISGERYDGMLLIRFEDGYSVPVNVRITGK